MPLYESRTAKLLSRRQFIWRLINHLGLATAFVVFSLILGMIGYASLAHMRWVDAFLNTAMLLGGMGPVGDLPNDASKIFAGIYALYAGLVFIASAGLILLPVAHRLLHRLHLDK
jgi:hypothetical protein